MKEQDWGGHLEESIIFITEKVALFEVGFHTQGTLTFSQIY